MSIYRKVKFQVLHGLFPDIAHQIKDTIPEYFDDYEPPAATPSTTTSATTAVASPSSFANVNAGSGNVTTNGNRSSNQRASGSRSSTSASGGTSTGGARANGSSSNRGSGSNADGQQHHRRISTSKTAPMSDSRTTTSSKDLDEKMRRLEIASMGSEVYVIVHQDQDEDEEDSHQGQGDAEEKKEAIDDKTSSGGSGSRMFSSKRKLSVFQKETLNFLRHETIDLGFTFDRRRQPICHMTSTTNGDSQGLFFAYLTREGKLKRTASIANGCGLHQSTSAPLYRRIDHSDIHSKSTQGRR